MGVGPIFGLPSTQAYSLKALVVCHLCSSHLQWLSCPWILTRLAASARSEAIVLRCPSVPLLLRIRSSGIYTILSVASRWVWSIWVSSARRGSTEKGLLGKTAWACAEDITLQTGKLVDYGDMRCSVVGCIERYSTRKLVHHRMMA